MLYVLFFVWTFFNVSYSLYLFRKSRSIRERDKQTLYHYNSALLKEQEAAERNSKSILLSIDKGFYPG